MVKKITFYFLSYELAPPLANTPTMATSLASLLPFLLSVWHVKATLKLASRWVGGLANDSKKSFGFIYFFLLLPRVSSIIIQFHLSRYIHVFETIPVTGFFWF
jgi:hypothetical protein